MVLYLEPHSNETWLYFLNIVPNFPSSFLSWRDWNTLYNVFLLRCELVGFISRIYMNIHIWCIWCFILVLFLWITTPGIIFGMGSANERQRYILMSSLIGWAHSLNDPCTFIKYLYMQSSWQARIILHFYHQYTVLRIMPMVLALLCFVVVW